jgi:DsbC/DsbD-like thiol-disulfide interchange protein
MKTKYLLLLLLTVNFYAQAQIENPIHWSYGIKKTMQNHYEVHLLATIDNGWHIYAQKQPKGAIAVPTQIEFQAKKGIILVGLPAEIGKKEKYTLQAVGITNYEYAGKVDFVQKIEIETAVKEIKGSIVFQACTHEHCLPQDDITFSIPIP